MLKSAKLPAVFGSSALLAAKRSFHKTQFNHAASIFRMPAMSPTMSEGGIVSWKLKPGEPFSSGDVLLEIETDKANIDVEAQDDGVMWEILEADGNSAIPVGKPIAFLAEPGDDLSTLEKPKIEESKPTNNDQVKEEKKAPITKEVPETNTSETKVGVKTEGDSSILTSANPSQKLSPSVEILLHMNSISREDAIKNIKASGPKGRILKGDVLAYLGQINTSEIERVSNFVKHREHLDLSNIVITENKPLANERVDVKAQEDKRPKNVLLVELQSELENQDSKESYKHSIKSSITAAIRDTYAHRFPEFATSPTSSISTSTFEDIVSPSVTESRFEVFDVEYDFQTPAKSKGSSSDDYFDDILGLTPSNVAATDFTVSSSNVSVYFKLKLNEKLVDSNEFVSYFERSLIENSLAKSLKFIPA